MALAIVLLIGGFVWLFAVINPYLSDFLGAEAAPSSTPTVAALQAGVQVTPTAAPVAPTATVAPSQSPTAAPSQSDAAPNPTGDFTPDYQVSGQGGVNFRSAAGTDGSDILAVLDPGTRLESTGQRETVDGVVWLEVTDEQGRTGWLRQIDMEAL